ncbi:uncharacterized protein isoform X2 [Rhodnius prolixus]
MNYNTSDGWRGVNSEARTSIGATKKDRSSGIFSIFRWFKRDRSNSVDSEDSYSPPTSPELLHRQPGSISGSVDTLFSTATAHSFAFVPPSYYRPFGSAAQPEIRIALGPETGTYRNRIRQRDRLRQLERNITLKEKYRLYGSGTLPRSVDRINEFPAELRESIFQSTESPGSRNSTFGRKKRRAPQPPCRETSTSDKSLPATLALESNRVEDEIRQHRRALSEPVKYVKISCHVKGKRKAPPPPIARADSEDVKKKSDFACGERTLSWKRKKRPAPPPPVQKEDANKEQIIDIVREAAHEIINQEMIVNGSTERYEDTTVETASNASTVDIGSSDIVATDTLRLERGILKPNKMEASIVEPKYSPSSPVSPRPWYKRQATQKDQHHVSKSNERKKDKKKVEDWMLESGFPRRVLTSNTDTKFNIFSKMDKSEDKRRSQISILTNISELDREAAEIIQKGKEMEKALIASHDAMFYTKTEPEDKDNFADLEANVEPTESPKRTSTRELISLFNAITNVTKVTVNTSFFSRDGLFKKESNEKRCSLFVDRTSIEEERNDELRQGISNGIESRRFTNSNNVSSEGTTTSSLANIYRTPDILITDNSGSSSSSGASEGKITKVTIEELDEYDAERNSKAQAMYEAHRLVRHQSPPIPTITEVSESSFKSSPASTLKSTTSESTSSEPPSPVQPSVSSSLLKSVVWVCPRCTLENLRWRITCEACDMWRPVPCEFKEQTQKPKTSAWPVLKIVEKKEEEIGKIKITNESSELKEPVNKTNTSVKSDELIIKELITSRESLSDTPKKSTEMEKRIREKQVPDEELLQSIPSTSKSEVAENREMISSIQALPLPAPPSEMEIKKESKNDESDDLQAEEIRKARLAFFHKNKQNTSKEGTLTKECQTLSEKPQASTPEKQDDKQKLREMLKEMKHSLPKRPKSEKVLKPSVEEEKKDHDRQQITQESLEAISKIPNLPVKKKNEAINVNETEKQEVINCDDNEKAEAYLVESETIVEEIHYRKPPEKVSSSVQTSAQVRAVSVLESKPPPVKEVIVPITVEEYRIKDGVLYTSITKKAKKIGTGTFHLMRPRDFANIEAIKTAGKAAVHVYANVSNGDPSSSTSSEGPEPSLPLKRSPILSKKSADLSLEKLSLQLTKPLGVASFRAGLAPGKENNNMNTLAVNRLLKRLEAAIATGHHELAAALARELAQMQISCSVTRQRSDNPTAMITVDLFVEDKTSHQGPIALRVRPSMTVLQLKQKMEREYEIPPKVQRWILGRKLANDDQASLESMGIDTPGTPIFMYLVAPGMDGSERAGIFNETIEVEEKPTVTTEEVEIMEEEPIIEEPRSLEIQAEPVKLNGTLALGWKCDTCTLVNSPTRPGCAACASNRPTNYAVPHEYEAGEAEARRLDLEKEMELKAEAVREEKQLNYQKMLDMVEKDDLIFYTEEFECPVCLMECEPMDGVVLRECLHVFCRPCLAQTVEFSEDAEVKCPFRDNNYTCDSTLLEREIKALVTAEVYEQHLAKSIALAETKIGNAFHCKTPDCKGWCIYEDNVNTFRCPVCTHNNCLTCQAVHEGLDCKQFQEQLNNDSDTNAESRRTKEMLQEMVDRGEAMNCPTCQVVLMKKWGCDWLKCSMCKTEICWITRGPRWGPNGKGDTSGGCQCGVNGVKCHPKCTYCH